MLKSECTKYLCNLFSDLMLFLLLCHRHGKGESVRLDYCLLGGGYANGEVFLK